MESNLKNKDIIVGKELKEKILLGINKLSEAVLTTMGPNGNTVIIADGKTPYITKDGVSVSKSVHLIDPIENIGATLLKEVANRTVDQAGDGTTTSICLANAFINTGFKLLENGVSYNDLKKAFDFLEQDVLKELDNISKPLLTKNIIDVATISANNDEAIGSIIEKAYNHSKIVKVEESNDIKDSLETVDGMKVLGSYYDKAFINNYKKKAIEYNDVELIIIKGKVNNITEIKSYLEGVKLKPILILADDYHTSVISILRDNYNKGALDIGLLKSPGFAQHRKDLIDDIIIYTNATHSIINKNAYITKLDSVLATKDSIIFTKENPNVTTRLNQLTDMLKVETEDYQKELLQQRIDNLEGKLSVIKVGGNSEIEMKERKDRVDDAVLAVKCALEEGIIPGGGHALKSIYDKLLYTKSPILELAICILAPYERINIRKINSKIVDPVKVTRCAFQNAISVSKTILNTEAIVIGTWSWN